MRSCEEGVCSLRSIGIKGKRVLVVGARSHISSALIETLLEGDAQVVLLDQDADASFSEARELGCEAIREPFDVTSPDRVRSVLRKAAVDKPFCGLVIASGFGPPTPLIPGDSELSRTVLEINLWGAANVMSAAGEILHALGKRGSIVAVSSINGEVPVRGYGAYCAAKAGLNMYVKVAALDLAPLIRVNAVAPGPLDRQDGVYAVFPALLDPLRRQHPLGNRLTSPTDVAKAVAVLLGDALTWITGQVLTVDGGLSISYGPRYERIETP